MEMLPADETPVKFDTPIQVKKTPHHLLVTIHGCVGTKLDGLHVYDGKDWHEVLPGQDNVDFVVNSLYQRLSILKTNKQ